MARGLVRNPEVFNNGVDLIIKGVNIAYDQVYRDIIWDIFNRILNQTPQFSGKAVANWNIGVGGPDYEFDDSLGDDIEMRGDPLQAPAHQKGDRKWMERARTRNRPKMALITRGKRVFINNGVIGDDGNGGTELYLEKFQDPSYWPEHLRMANKPYETAQESVIFMTERIGRRRGIGLKASGNNMANYP